MTLTPREREGRLAHVAAFLQWIATVPTVSETEARKTLIQYGELVLDRGGLIALTGPIRRGWPFTQPSGEDVEGAFYAFADLVLDAGELPELPE